MNEYYRRCIPVYVSSVLLGIVADLINNLGPQDHMSRFETGFFILIPLGVLILSAVIPRLEAKTTFAAAVWGAIILFCSMVFAFWYYAFRQEGPTDSMWGIVYMVGAIPAVIAGAHYGIVLLRKTPGYQAPTARVKGTLLVRIRRGGPAALLFISCVYLVSAVTPLFANRWGIASNDYVMWRRAIVTFGIYGTVLALPAAILMLIKISDRKERKVATPRAMPIKAGIAYGAAYALGVALGTSDTQGYIFMFLTFGPLVALKLYFSESIRARIQAIRG